MVYINQKWLYSFKAAGLFRVIIKNIKIMKKSTIRRANDRGSGDYGWLKTRYSFSFSNYYNPENVHFGLLRVINDDFIEGGMGFGTHPHDNMEIITIPLEGELAHKDSMGNTSIIKHGEVQVMSAGSGITHSEFYANEDIPAKVFQIWIIPKTRDVEPRYGQEKIDLNKPKNNFLEIVTPNKDNRETWIHQNAWISLGYFDEGFSKDYELHKNGNGIYAMVIDGTFIINGEELSKRDAVEIEDTEKISIKATDKNSRIMLIEVPMHN